MKHEILPLGDYSVVSVADTGVGIAAELLGKIFEPFYTTKEVGKGTGLGLSTVYGIVKQSGGYIFADSRLGEGTTFSIYLPVHAALPEEVAAQPAPVQQRQVTETWGTGTILLVEDEDMVRAVAERALTRQGYTVITASDGEQGLARLASAGRVDLLISDVMMPVMDGPTMVRAARAHDPNLPVLFMSGYAEEQLRKSIDIDHIAFLPKPFSVTQLAEAARDVLAEARARYQTPDTMAGAV
jgi:two-component system cell cycle sensor histidine kinase/response regulator CckA